jgi:hypothetical protein
MGQVLTVKSQPSINDDMSTRLFRRFVQFGGFAVIYLGGSALLDSLEGVPWDPDPFVFVAYAVGALCAILLNKKSDNQRT